MHFHITEPNLGDLTHPELDHASIGKTLKKSGYNNWLSIEMRRSDNPLTSIEKSIDLVQQHYS
jgi:sugar phosphate isomerase/epimerase